MRHRRLGAFGARWFLAFQVLSTWFGAALAAPLEPAVWLCVYDQEVTIDCRLVSAPGAVRPVAARQPELEAARSEPVDAYRARGEMHPLIALMRTDPAAFAGRRVSIPMFAPSEDPEFTRQLADAVVCGSNRACVVDFRVAEGLFAMLPDAAPAD